MLFFWVDYQHACDAASSPCNSPRPCKSRPVASEAEKTSSMDISWESGCPRNLTRLRRRNLDDMKNLWHNQTTLRIPGPRKLELNPLEDHRIPSYNEKIRNSDIYHFEDGLGWIQRSVDWVEHQKPRGELLLLVCLWLLQEWIGF